MKCRLVRGVSKVLIGDDDVTKAEAEWVLLQHLLVDENLSLTARHTNYSQSALSMKIKRLEQDLGTKIFDRTTSGLKRTAAEDAYLQFLATQQQAYTQLMKKLHAQKTIFRIGLSNSSLKRYSTVLANAEKRFASQFDYVVEDSATLNNQVLQGVLDCAITTNPLKHFPELMYDKLADENFVVLSDKRYKQTLTSQQLTLYATHRECVYTQSVVAWLEAQQKQVMIKILPSPENIRDFLTIPQTITVLNKQLVETYHYTDVIAHELPISQQRDTVWIARHSTSRELQYVKEMVLQLEEEMQNALITDRI